MFSHWQDAVTGCNLLGEVIELLVGGESEVRPLKNAGVGREDGCPLSTNSGGGVGWERPSPIRETLQNVHSLPFHPFGCLNANSCRHKRHPTAPFAELFGSKFSLWNEFFTLLDVGKFVGTPRIASKALPRPLGVVSMLPNTPKCHRRRMSHSKKRKRLRAPARRHPTT